MNESLIALSSIVVGVFGVIIYTKLSNSNYFSLTANVIISVFGSVFFTKSFGSLGLKPTTIFSNDSLNIFLLIGYYFISISGGVITLIIIKKVASKYNLEN